MFLHFYVDNEEEYDDEEEDQKKKKKESEKKTADTDDKNGTNHGEKKDGFSAFKGSGNKLR